MIKLVKKGQYQLVETKVGQTKLLILDNQQSFAWINAKDIGEILVTTQKQHPLDSVLSTGEYRLYDVDDEPKLSDQLHLELKTGTGTWQGYLLPTGLPTKTDIRNRIIPTRETIT